MGERRLIQEQEKEMMKFIIVVLKWNMCVQKQCPRNVWPKIVSTLLIRIIK
jgi:hypothetical protein